MRAFPAITSLFLLQSAAAQTAEKIDRVLAFDLNEVPAPEELLDAISERDAYQTPTAKYHALGAIQSALTSLMMSFPFGGVDSPDKQAEIDAFLARLAVPRSAYAEKMEALKPTIDDDRQWQIPQHRLRLPILNEFLPKWGTLNPELIERFEIQAGEESSAEAQGERFGIVPVVIFLVAALVGLILVLRQTARRVSGPEFDFQLTPMTATVVQEKRWNVTETSGSIGGGGSVSPGVQQPVSGSISSKTTNFQEITLQGENGKEQVLKYKDFEIPCMEGNTLTLTDVSRPGMGVARGAIYNHNRDELHLFREGIRSAIRPPNSGMPWLGWWLWFAFLGVGLAWFAGETLDEGIEVIIISILIFTTVPTFIVAFVVSMTSLVVTRSRVPKVVAGIKTLVSELNR